MTNHIHWLIDTDDGSFSTVTNSTMASQRLRAGCMMREAKPNGFVVTAGRAIPPRIKRLIIGKIGADRIHLLRDQWLDLLRHEHSTGTHITLDFTDNHLDVPTELTTFYHETLSYVSDVVCSSETLAIAMRKHYSGSVTCIPDPIEVLPQPPKSKPFWPRTLLWFGHNTNLPYLVNFLPRLQANVPIRLLILSDIGGLKELERANLPIPGNLLIELRNWTKESMIEAAYQSDCCIIPSNPQDPRKAGVSSNRLLTALALGLPTIASQLASYIPFAQYFTDINSAKSSNVVIDPCAFSNQVAKAQRVIIPRYSLQHIAKQWFDLSKKP